MQEYIEKKQKQKFKRDISPNMKHTRPMSNLVKRPMSSFGKEVSQQKNKLMKQTNAIRRSIAANKSLIQNSRDMVQKQEDDQLIAK